MRNITLQHRLNYEAYLRHEERSNGTIEKYLRDVKRFAVWAVRNRFRFSGSFRNEVRTRVSLFSRKIPKRSVSQRNGNTPNKASRQSGHRRHRSAGKNPQGAGYGTITNRATE